MRNASLKIICSFVFFWAICQMQRLLFAAIYFDNRSFADLVSVCYHGSAMDCSVAGYLTAPIALLVLISVFLPTKTSRIAIGVYTAIAAILLSAITILDTGLYGYWGFRLDSTPFFYFFSSPKSALASMTAMQLVCAPIALIVLVWGIWMAYRLTVGRIALQPVKGATQRIGTIGILLVLTGLLIIPIRGGIGLAPMNLSRAYFSDDKLLNHAAVNPEFSLLYSLTHPDPSATDFNYFGTDEEAEARWEEFLERLRNQNQSDNAGIEIKLRTDHPDIYLIILESFSSHLLPSQGGKPVAMRLDSIAATGVLFDNFYANSFRTDRALPSILSGLPAQPSMSLLKYAEKTEKLPSIASVLSEHGYDTRYYYGGDINFANMQAYLVNAGYESITSVNDFPRELRTGKWGVHDADLFDRVIERETASSKSGKPRFITIQTSSSHEPFIVPYTSEFGANTPLNAFAYTDNAIGDFMERLKASTGWDNSLVIIVPDHLGAWPLDKEDASERHHIPLILTGGALMPGSRGRIATAGAQSDIPATLLSLLSIDSSPFKFSNNLLAPEEPHYGLFTEPELIGIISATDTLYYNTTSEQIEKGSETDRHAAQSYLQLLYRYISEL